MASVEFEAEDDDEEGELSYNELYEFVRLIPVSLSTGRKKVDVAETALLKGSHLNASPSKNTSNVVEMFTPHRPS